MAGKEPSGEGSAHLTQQWGEGVPRTLWSERSAPAKNRIGEIARVTALAWPVHRSARASLATAKKPYRYVEEM